jgi:phospholipid transport system substrate-binding protein
MKSRPVLAAFLAVAGIGYAVAAGITAESRLRAALDDVLAVSSRATSPSALATAVGPVLQRHVRFETMTRRAVGVGWRQFTPEQQERATGLFTTLVIRSYSDKFTPGEQPVIQYKTAVLPAPGRVDVPTSLIYKGSHYAVSYRLEEVDDWKIVDVVIEGVSLVGNYRSQFDSIFKQGGVDAVIRCLEQSVAPSR